MPKVDFARSVDDDLKAAGLSLSSPTGHPVLGAGKELIVSTFLDLNGGGRILNGCSQP